MMKRLALLAAVPVLLLLTACADTSSDPGGGAIAGDEPELKANEASLVVPLIDENKKLLSRYNAAAKAKGLKEMPDTFEVKTQADAQKVSDLRSYFADKTMDAVGAKTQPMPAWGPDSFTNWSKKSKVPGLCYRGNPNKVIDLMQKMTDTVFSDQLTIYGWKYKKADHFLNGAEDSADDFPDVWKEWRGESTAILVIFAQGDGGDDITPSIIPRCK